jgi:hypothetical protein
MNQNHINNNPSSYALIPIIKVVKWTFLVYNAILFYRFLDFLVQNPVIRLEVIIQLTYASGWGYLVFIGPFILLLATIEYFIKQTFLENIPKDTTIYESITRPTLMYGSIKIISPKIDAENDKIN